ncbi:BMP family ABC transporter substrate-binding protein [Paenibacillus sp. FSL R7-0048]|jgi:basic membrane protein A|uniref:BMP family ABC transporter substrate-binding protein n=1 Tax=Paenibacillus odorifer TaxID=189426 RepID=A0A1R0YWR0_9BACL|nr:MULTISPECIES: BMP family ABC transporter substrate-binding protein [Paenibacillus]AWV32265.1 BMP family ABC transporter substrate-binding protein [Paenibacillus odorifer]MDH6425707.1 basic membrane protein A [Paenibacillus sp. PastH-4]MDH6441727.1 basic membrane protein A [Paenibacillus sp. PastF-4]MDH6529762.1 basic membrane protein A [Paenibacillus sp. PastH-3]OMC65046.1 BMP family ABC transporter substrate-binding protein [Paenibacillus odorifer]
MKKGLKLSLAMLLSLTVVLTGCGNNNNNAAKGETNAGTNAGTNAPKSDFKFGMVTDIGGVNDKSFNQSAWEALQALEKETGSGVKYLQSKSNADYEPNLNSFVKDGYNLTWGIGFDLGDAIKKVATENPNANLAIIDSVVEAPNVASVTFSENEGSFLVGVVAGLTTKTNKVAFIGGLESPVIKRFEAGFKAGVAAVNPSAKVTPTYAGGYDKPDVGKSLAATLYNDGNDIIFPAAGQTGNGVFNEAKARNKAGGTKVWVIGVDKDQSIEFGTDVTLTSMIKRVDEAVLKVSKEVIDGTFKGGTTTVLGLKDNGVGISDTKDNVSEEILAKVEEYKKQIIDGTITVPSE